MRIVGKQRLELRRAIGKKPFRQVVFGNLHAHGIFGEKLRKNVRFVKRPHRRQRIVEIGTLRVLRIEPIQILNILICNGLRCDFWICKPLIVEHLLRLFRLGVDAI